MWGWKFSFCQQDSTQVSKKVWILNMTPHLLAKNKAPILLRSSAEDSRKDVNRCVPENY